MKVMVRYGAISSVGVLIDLGIFFIFAKVLGFNFMWVATAAFVIATFVNYELCARFVFDKGVRFNKHHEMMLVFLVSAIGLVLTQAILYTMVTIAKAELMTSKITATFIVFLWNYLVRKHFVFRAA